LYRRFLLAAAGLLDGRRAVTHWKDCGRLAQRFPTVHVERDPIFVRDGRVRTSVGVTAGIDLALALVEEDLGSSMALAVARYMVVVLKRPGGQAQFSAASATLRRQLGRRRLRPPSGRGWRRRRAGIRSHAYNCSPRSLVENAV